MEFEQIQHTRQRLYNKDNPQVCTYKNYPLSQQNQNIPQFHLSNLAAPSQKKNSAHQKKKSNEGFSLNKILGPQNKENLQHKKPPSHHRRSSSHRRQSSIYFNQEVSYEKVLKTLQQQEVQTQYQQSTTCTIENIAKKQESSIRSSLPIWGSMPTTAYCNICKKEVHSRLDCKDDTSMPHSILKIMQQLFQCCQAPVWLRNYWIHRCSECNTILAKIQA